MAHFIGNDSFTFNSESIIVIYWSVTDDNGLTYAEVHLKEKNEICLYYVSDEDYKLINDLRELFGYENLPRLK